MSGFSYGLVSLDIFLKFHWDLGDDTTDTATIDADSAGVYTSISEDGASGTITVSVNGGGFVAFATLNPLTLIATDTIAFFRTTTTGAGFAKLTGTFWVNDFHITAVLRLFQIQNLYYLMVLMSMLTAELPI